MIPLVRPTLPNLKSLHKKMEDVFTSGILTNSKYVSQFEKNCAKKLGVADAVAVSSGTLALILAFKCLNLSGEVILPSFTFTSGGHSLLWCGLKPVFADIDRKTFNIDPDSIEKKITKNTTAILATHVFGNPCEIQKIQDIARKHGLKVIYDAAHAFGSKYHNKQVSQFGDALIFSLTPTKVLTAGEGGIVITKDRSIMKKIRFGRNNGDNFDRSKEFLGITARMPELSAILGIEALKIFPKCLKNRIRLVDYYKNELGKIPGIYFQKITPGCTSVYKDFTIMVDKKEFGASRDELLSELLQNGIETKVYFDPPLHKKSVYKNYKKAFLPNTDFVSAHIMNLPIYSHMPLKYAKKVCMTIKKLYEKRK